MRSDQCQIFTLLSHPTRLTCWIRRASLTTNWSEKMSKSFVRISMRTGMFDRFGRMLRAALFFARGIASQSSRRVDQVSLMYLLRRRDFGSYVPRFFLIQLKDDFRGGWLECAQHQAHFLCLHPRNHFFSFAYPRGYWDRSSQLIVSFPASVSQRAIFEAEDQFCSSHFFEIPLEIFRQVWLVFVSAAIDV